jgi:hypothetical protein
MSIGRYSNAQGELSPVSICGASAEFGWSKAEKSSRGSKVSSLMLNLLTPPSSVPQRITPAPVSNPNLLHLAVLGNGMFRLRSSATMVLIWLVGGGHNRNIEKA